MEKFDITKHPYKGASAACLYEAIENNDLESIQFLLENGVDPNACNPDSADFCPLWDLQYPPDDESDCETRYEIAKLFFKYGADPNIEWDGETLFDFVTYEIYNHVGQTWEFGYLCRFYKLLVLYGGGGHGYGKPEFSEPIIHERADEYSIAFEICEDGYHIRGHLLNPEGKEIGVL